MLTTSLGQVVGKKITTTLYSSVVDPVLQIVERGWSSRPRDGGEGGGSLKKFFFGLEIRGPFPGPSTVVNSIETDCA